MADSFEMADDFIGGNSTSGSVGDLGWSYAKDAARCLPANPNGICDPDPTTLVVGEWGSLRFEPEGDTWRAIYKPKEGFTLTIEGRGSLPCWRIEG